LYIIYALFMTLKDLKRVGMTKLILAASFFLLLTLIIFKNSRPARAYNTCGFSISGTSTVSSNCSITGTDGIDSGDLVIAPGVTINVGATSTFVMNQGYNIIFESSSSVVTIAGSKPRAYYAVQKGVLCTSDPVIPGHASDSYAALLSPGQTQPVFMYPAPSAVCPTSQDYTNYTQKKNLLSLSILECKPDTSGNYYYLSGGVCTICPSGNYCAFNPAAGTT
jgi:hypothetical protein